MNRANNSAFTCSNAFFLSRQPDRNLHPESTAKSHKHRKHFEKSLCFIPLSIPLRDTRSFCSVQEARNFPGRRIVEAFWEILISSQQRKGKREEKGSGVYSRGVRYRRSVSWHGTWWLNASSVATLSNPLCTVWSTVCHLFFMQGVMSVLQLSSETITVVVVVVVVVVGVSVYLWESKMGTHLLRAHTPLSSRLHCRFSTSAMPYTA